MTNLTIVVSLWVNLVTNPVPSGVTTNGENFFEVSSVSSVQQYLPDGAFLNASTMAHHSYVTNQATAPGLRTIKQFSPPPMPPSAFRSLLPSSFSSRPVQASNLANGGPDLANYCLMFKSSFLTQTNFIYGLYSSYDMVNWSLCPPEIDGTGTGESFFDECLTNEIRTYRIMARAGVLPP
jgi:hypothetical protein